jgi:2-keto-4-pentenoate hydratase/2-oxohepta-3-ene-1,7-dioic acid hydratase in catechol pathway
MIWCRFEASARVAYGIVDGDDVIEVEGSPFGPYTRTRTRHRLSAIKLHPPCIPPTFYAAGINYRDHVTWATDYFKRPYHVPTRADIGYRAVNALIGHDEPIVIPKDSAGEVHYEGELVAVIGKRAKRLSKEQALSCVLGYTIGNDLSERAWQSADRTQWRAKNTDTFKPMGPWIVTDIDPSTSETTVRVNDEVVSKFPTGNMIYDVASYIVEMSKYLTLHPGDVIWMGTDGATVPALRPGDVVEVAISGIGTLRNPVSAEM